MRIPLILLAANLTVATARLAAQQPDSTQNPAPAPRACFRGQPLPACRSSWITEFGLARRMSGNSIDSPSDATLATWELGWMKNVGTDHALGIAIVAHADAFTGWGIRPRWRTWVNPTTSIDLAPGILLGANPGFSGQAALNFGDYAGFTAQVMVLGPTYHQSGKSQVNLYLGGRLGSLPGTIAGIAAPVFVIAAFLIACSRGCD